jgi:hypothetical protein
LSGPALPSLFREDNAGDLVSGFVGTDPRRPGILWGPCPRATDKPGVLPEITRLGRGKRPEIQNFLRGPEMGT